MSETQTNIERKFNPDLPILKDNWQGNVMIYSQGNRMRIYQSKIES